MNTSVAHQHAFAMCIHHDADQMWHAACAAADCNEDHWFYEAKLRRIACAFCGSPNHFPIECPQPATAYEARQSDANPFDIYPDF